MASVVPRNVTRLSRRAGPSSTLQTIVHTARGYATVFKTDPSPTEEDVRVFPHRKAHIYAKYVSLLKDSPALILLKQENLTTTQLSNLRRDLLDATTKLNKLEQKKKEAAGGTTDWEGLDAQLSVLRPGILVPAVRSAYGKKVTSQIKPLLKGQVTALVLPTLSPPHLTALLRVLDRAVPVPPPETAKKATVIDNFEPKEKPTPIPRLSVLGAFIDGRVVLKNEGVREVAKLPTLDTLRAQIIGLLSAPAANLAQVLGQASGGDVLRTLQGFQKGLEMDAEGKGDAPAAAS